MTRLATTERDDALSRPVVAGWLGLAAAPVFALMAGLSVLGAPVVCADLSPLPVNEMALMYLLMSLFHLPSWLKFVSSQRGAHHPN